jgi:carbon monoxide dehydrogenase subunit G
VPEATHEIDISVPIQTIWDFVKDMNNWAPMVTGYQRHEVYDDRNSLWVLKGDMGALSRTVELEVKITEWNGPHEVRFLLKGKNEDVTGDGTFQMTAADGGGAQSDDLPAQINVEPANTLWARFIRWLFSILFKDSQDQSRSLNEKPETQSEAQTRLSFRLKMEAGGPMAPMVNAMLGPALVPATESLANNIAQSFDLNSQPTGD